jgi:hypothetical protein
MEDTLAHPHSVEDTSTHHPKLRSSERQRLVKLELQAYQTMKCLRMQRRFGPRRPVALVETSPGTAFDDCEWED